jgi:hypothetical protein
MIEKLKQKVKLVQTQVQLNAVLNALASSHYVGRFYCETTSIYNS